MKKWIILILVPFILASCNFPLTNTSTPTAAAGGGNLVTEVPTAQIVVVTATSQPADPTATGTPLPQFTGTERNLGGIYMVIPECLASDASGVILPENNPGPDSLVFDYNPEYRKITFTGYPLTDKFWEPSMMVYPVARFVELVPDLAGHVSQMQQVLADQPAAFEHSIPLLPIENAAQIFRAQISYLNFQNGKGIGFLTEYGQYYAPVNNHDLFYTYQGLTNDGKYWVSVFLPVTAPYLQPSYDDATLPAGGIAMPDLNSGNVDQVIAGYYEAMDQKLNDTAAGDFSPSLDCMKQFVQSLNVSG